MTQEEEKKSFLDFIKTDIEETRNLVSWAGSNVANFAESLIDNFTDNPDVYTHGPSSDSFLFPGFRTQYKDEILKEITGLGPDEIKSLQEINPDDGLSHPINITVDYQTMEKSFSSRGLGVPEELSKYARTAWGDKQTLVLDPNNKEEVLREADRLRGLGYRRVSDPVPNKKRVWSEELDKDVLVDDGLWSEEWATPKVTHYPNWDDEKITAGQVVQGVIKSVRKGQVPESTSGMIAKMGLDIAMGLGSMGATMASDPAIQETGGIYQENNSFDAALNTIELAFPAATALVGPIDNNIRAAKHLWQSKRFKNTGNFTNDFRAISNVKGFDSSLDVREFGESSVRQVQSLMDQEMPEDQANYLMRMIGQMSISSGEESDYLASVLQFNRVSEGTAQSAFEMTFSSPNKFAPEGYLFKLSTVDQADIAPMRQNFDEWISFADDHGSTYFRDQAGGQLYNSDTKTFNSELLLNFLTKSSKGKVPRNVPANPIYGSYSGLKLHTEEIYGLGIDRFLKERRNVSIDELKEYMDTNRIKVTEMIIGDMYSRDTFASKINSPSSLEGAVLLKLDVPNMNANSHIRKALHGEESTDAGHYGRDLRVNADIDDDVDNITGITRDLFEQGTYTRTNIPESARTNIFVSGRYSLRTDSNGNKVFHIDEIQSDLLQRTETRSPTDTIRAITNTLETHDESPYPVIWGNQGDNENSSWMLGRFSAKPIEVSATIEGEPMALVGTDVFISPVSKHAASEGTVDKKYETILKQFEADEIIEDFEFDKQRPNVIKSALIRPFGEDANVASTDTYDDAFAIAEDNMFLVELLEHVPSGARRFEGGEPYKRVSGSKSPVIRISYLNDELNPPSPHNPFADVFDTPADGLHRLGNGIIQGFARRKFDPQRVRWTKEQIVANEANPFKIIKSSTVDEKNRELWELTDGVHNWGEYNSRGEAADALLSWIGETSRVNNDEFLLPPNFLFNSGNFHIPILRRHLFHAAMEGVGSMTIDSAQTIVQRYGSQALPYALNRYGQPGERDGQLKKGMIKVITDVMHTAGWSRWTDKDSKALFETNSLPTATEYRSYDDWANDPNIDIDFKKHSPSIGDRLYSLAFKIDEGIATPQHVVDHNLDAKTYQFVGHEFEEEIKTALDSLSVDEIIKRIAVKKQMLADADADHSAFLDDVAETLREMQTFEYMMQRDKSRLWDWINTSVDEQMLYEYNVQLPQFANKELFSLLDNIEYGGIPVRNMANQASRKDVLNAIIEEALQITHQDNALQFEDIIGIKQKGLLIPNPNSFSVPVENLRLKDNLLDSKVRNRLGITTTPDSDLEALPSLSEALTTLQMRLFQVNDSTPRNGKVLGFTDFPHDGKYLVNFVGAANFKVAAHEIGHVFRRLLNEDNLRIAGEYSMGRETFNNLINKNVWTRAGEEKFAEAFERYLLTDYAESREIRSVFQQFKEYIKNIIRAIKGTPAEESLDPNLKQMFDRLLKENRPSVRKIKNTLPEHLHKQALKFYGYRVDDFIVADDGFETVDGVTRYKYVPESQVAPDGTPGPIEGTTLREDSPDRLYRMEEPDGDGRLRDGETPPSTSIDPDGSQVTPPLEPLSSLQTMEDVLSANMIMNNWRRLAQLPIINFIAKRLDPTTASNNPLFKALVAHTMLKSEGDQKSLLAYSKLSRIGSQSSIFGNTDDVGNLTQGTLRGTHVNDIRSNPDKYWSRLTSQQKEYVTLANELEDAKLQLLQSEGIDIKLLEFEEGGRYAGRKIAGRIMPDGEIIDVAVLAGPGRPGLPMGAEKTRVFQSANEATDAGYIVLSDDEALLRNLQGAYRRIADKRATDYILNNVVNTRTSGAPEALIEQRAIAQARVKGVRELISQLQQARRGGQIHALTRKKLENLLPEIEGMLDDVSQITLQQLVKAGTVAANQPTSFVPTKLTIRKLFEKVNALEMEVRVLRESGQVPPSELIERLNTMKKRLGFNKYAMGQAYKNYQETGTFEYTFSKSATSILMEDRIGSIDELMRIIRGSSYEHVTFDSGVKKVTTRYGGGFLDTVQDELKVINQNYLDVKASASTKTIGEGSLSGQIPAFSGRFFIKDQPTNLLNAQGNRMNGSEVERMITDSMLQNQQFSELLNNINTANGAFRFFQLAGDMSAFGIQLLFLTGQAARRPKILGNALRGFVHAFLDETTHSKILYENRELIARHPNMMLSSTGTEFTEFTRNMSNSGLVRTRPIRMAGDVIGAVPGTKQAGRLYLGGLKRAQQGFEAALDIAGIELMKSLDHKAIDARSTQQIDDFVNEIRGLANPARLGTTAKQRQIESLVMLAPRYNRAIAAMLGDFFIGGGIRGAEARKNIASSIGFISAMGVLFSLANGEDPDEMIEHFIPTSPMFFTWNVGGQNIGVGSKVRSLIKLSAGIYTTMSRGEGYTLFDASMENPGIRFLRGNASPILSSGIDMLNGHNYMGEPVYGNGWDLKSWVTNFSKTEVLPKTMPIWAQAVLLEDGSIGDRATRGTVEFFGGRGYPESSYQVIKNYSDNILGLPYEDLEPFERKLLRSLLTDQLLPMHEQRLLAGDKTARFWEAMNTLDADRYAKEQQLINQFYQPRKYPQFLINGAQRVRQEFALIQNNYHRDKQVLNEQFKMYQDDVEYDENDPGKFLLSEWYQLYAQAEYEGSGVFDGDKLERLQRVFWRRTLPNGEPYTNYVDYINRNTSTTKHPPGFEGILSRGTVTNWRETERLQSEFLQNRGNWAKVLDNTQ